MNEGCFTRLTMVAYAGNNHAVATSDADLPSLLQALAEPTRLHAVQLLSERPRRAGELAEQLGVTAPAMSKHLRVLLNAGVVSDERLVGDARARLFRLRPESVVALRAWLDQLQAHWDEQLSSFRIHVERRTKR
jgi:DNA-binding transcriptional ArsR family regulator